MTYVPQGVKGSDDDDYDDDEDDNGLQVKYPLYLSDFNKT
jgi:hypothetical protein